MKSEREIPLSALGSINSDPTTNELEGGEPGKRSGFKNLVKQYPAASLGFVSGLSLGITAAAYMFNPIRERLVYGHYQDALHRVGGHPNLEDSYHAAGPWIGTLLILTIMIIGITGCMTQLGAKLFDDPIPQLEEATKSPS